MGTVKWLEPIKGYASRRDQFGRLFYGSLGIQQSDTAARARQTSKNYGFFALLVT
jgi:hypothetical protein